MNNFTTIQIDKKLLEKLKNAKDYPRQTYNEVLDKDLSLLVSNKKKNSYDEFLHKIQQQKIKDLWDNKADEEWENA